MTQAGTAVGIAHRQVASLADERASLTRSIDEYGARLDGARRTIERFDRPIVRRRHAVELDAARHQLGSLPGSIDQAKAKLARLARQQRDATQQPRRAGALERSRPQLVAERTTIRTELEHDARARAQRLATDPPTRVVERLGPPPQRQAARLWLDAAGRLAQHHAAFELPDTTLLGEPPHPIGDDAYASSHRAAVQAIERLDRALGRQPAIEPPQRSLGLSL